MGNAKRGKFLAGIPRRQTADRPAAFVFPDAPSDLEGLCLGEFHGLCQRGRHRRHEKKQKPPHANSLSVGPEARKGRVLFGVSSAQNRLAQNEKTAKIGHHDLGSMTNPTRQKPLPKAVLILIVLGVVGLGVVFAFLATLGDDVPNSLPPAGERSPGN